MNVALLVASLLAADELMPLSQADVPVTLEVKQVNLRGADTHAASRTTMRETGTDAGVPLVLNEKFQPVFDRVLPIDGGWALIGWSSDGSGMQSHDVQIVKAAPKLAAGATLSWTTDRRERCLIVAKDASGWKIGIPRGARSGALRIDGRGERPSFGEFVGSETTWGYCPPGGETMKAPRGVAWFRLGAAGFVEDR